MSSECTRLEDVAEVIDSLHKTPSYCLHGFPMVRVTDVKYGNLDLTSCHRVDEPTYLEFSRRFGPQIGDIVITRVGTYGVSSMVKDVGFCLGQNTAAIVPKCINSRYLYAALNSELVRSQIEGAVVGSTQKSLSLKSIKSLVIPRHGSDVEEAIAGVIGGLDDRITLLRETNATLEAIAQALFKSWFVDFDPVRAKAEGREPEGMDAPTAALFPDSFEESELGLVPKGWRVGSLTDVCTIASGKRPPDRSDDSTAVCSIPLYGGAGLMGYTSASLFDEALIVTGRVGTLGKVHIAYPPFWASDNVLVVSPKTAADFSFALHWIRSIDVQALNRGSTQPLLTQRDLGAQQGLIPSREVLRKFEEIVGQLYDRIRAQELQAKTLTQLRDTLLPRLISGQLRLPEAEQVVEETLA